MTEEQKDELRKRNQNRAWACRGCNGSVEMVDGSACGGMPGIQYRLCRGCGRADAVGGKKPRKADNPLFG